MFLRHNKRIKDGKTHRYWSVVENRRIASGRTVQKTLLYLGEINDSDHASWTRAIAALDHNNHPQQIHLFPADRTPSPQLTNPTLKLHLDRLELSRPRQWGGCWLAMELWDRLNLDAFWQPLLPDSRKGTPWLKVLKALVAYRLLQPGSEWKLHHTWFDRSAMAGDRRQKDAVRGRGNVIRRASDALRKAKEDVRLQLIWGDGRDACALFLCYTARHEVL